MKVTVQSNDKTFVYEPLRFAVVMGRWLRELDHNKRCATITVIVHQDGPECDHEHEGPKS